MWPRAFPSNSRSNTARPGVSGTKPRPRFHRGGREVRRLLRRDHAGGATETWLIVTLVCGVLAWSAAAAHAEITRHAGSDEALPDKKYVHVVSESDSPVMQTWIKAKDGAVHRGGGAQAKGKWTIPRDHHVPRRAGRPWHGSARGLVARRSWRPGVGAVPAGRLRGRGGRLSRRRRGTSDEHALVDRPRHGHRRRHHGGRLRAEPAVREAPAR